MSMVPLSEVCDITAGQSAPQDSDAFGPEGHPFIRAGSLNALTNGGSENDCEHLTEKKAQQYRMRLFPKDTIVFAKSGMSAKIGRVYRLKAPAYIVSHLAAVTPGKDVDPSYLQRWFERNPPSRLIPNEAYPSIRTSEIGALKIELPKKSEQKRIAAILDKADAIRRKRQQAIQLADEFLRSVFLDMFGDPGTNPNNWPMGTIRELAADVRYGSSSKAGAKGKFPILRMNNITYTGSWNFDDLKYINLSEKDQAKYLVHQGELLFNRTNSKELVGKTAVYRETSPMAFAGYLIRVRTNELANPEYISAYLNSRHGKLTLESMSLLSR
ncbi:MAG: restriction endonuclease subunit S [Candidatus Thiodiazotropha sp.]